MYTFLAKRGQLVAFVLGLVITVIFLAIAIGNQSEYALLSDEQKFQTTIFNFGLISALVLIVVCAAAAIVAGLIQVVTHFKSSVEFLVSAAILLLIFAAFYMTASGEAPLAVRDTVEQFDISAGEYKLITAGLKTTGVLLGLAVLAFVVSEIINFFK